MGDVPPGTAEPLTPHLSPWHLLGAVIRHYRVEVRKRSIRTLAGQIFIDYSLLSKWERGERRVPADAAALLDEALDTGGIIPALQRLAEEIEKRAASRQGSLLAAHADDMDAERRRLLRLAALGALTTTTAAGEALRQLIDASPALAATRTLDDWEMACSDHVHALLTRPAAEASADLLIDLASIQRLIADGSATVPLTALHYFTARLAAMQGDAATRLGEYGAARRWWSTARKAADASGDQPLRAWIRGEEAVFGLYGLHSPETSLKLAREGREIAGDTPSRGLAEALCGEVQALAVLGDHATARRHLAHLHDLTGRFGSPKPGEWREEHAWFATSWVHTYAGESSKAADAQEQALRLNRGYQNRANLHLHRAIGLVQEGGHDEGLRLATEIIDGLAPAYRSQMIMATARRVLTALPRDHRPTPALTTYQAILNAN